MRLNFFSIFSWKSSEHKKKTKLIYSEAENKAESSWQVSSLWDLPYIHRKIKQTLAPQVARIFFIFVWTCWRLYKLQFCLVGKIVYTHSNISSPLSENLKLCALFRAQFQTKVTNLSQEWPLHTVIVLNSIFKDFQKKMCHLD